MSARHRLLAGGLLLFSVAGCRTVTAPDIAAFREMARGAPCADRANDLYVIDHAMVFWRREGSCADAAYAYTLYGATPESLLCERHDSIAGPQERCAVERAHALFRTMVAHLDEPDLGLGNKHTVERLPPQ